MFVGTARCGRYFTLTTIRRSGSEPSVPVKSAVVADSAVRPELRTAGFAETPAKGRPRPKCTLPGYALSSLTRVHSATSPKCLRPRAIAVPVRLLWTPQTHLPTAHARTLPPAQTAFLLAAVSDSVLPSAPPIPTNTDMMPDARRQPPMYRSCVL